MRIIRAADCRRMPWKNGGGETVEIAISPEDAGLDDFDWRLSMARVESDGPFSLFADVDRTLAILEGEGIILRVGDRIPFGVTGRSDPLSFPADIATSANLIAGPITDLNMMTRRGKATHSLRRLTVAGVSNIPIEAGELLLFCRSGSVGIGSSDSLHPLDTLHMQEPPEALQVSANGAAELFLIEIEKSV